MDGFLGFAGYTTTDDSLYYKKKIKKFLCTNVHI